MRIDCDTCAVRDLRCGDCVVSVLLGPPGARHVHEVDDPEQAALAVLADSGLVPRLQLVPLGLPGPTRPANPGPPSSPGEPRTSPGEAQRVV